MKKWTILNLEGKYFVGAEGHIVSRPLDTLKEAEEFISEQEGFDT